MLLSNEAELLAMETDIYSGISPIVVDNNNLTIGLDSGFMDAVSSISGAISGLDNKLDISAFTGYSASLDSGLSNAFETVHNDITGLQNDDSYLSGSIDYLSGVVTTGLSAYSAGPNINITDFVISGKDWLDTIQEASAYAAQDAFTGVTTDSTLTGDGKNDPLGVASVQSLTSDNSISITSGENEVILGVNSSWFDSAVNSAVTGAQGDVEVNTYVHNNSATINEVNTTVQSNSGDWNGVYNTVNSNSGLWSAGDTEVNNVVHNNSATWNTVTDKLDTTSFSTVSGTFLTAVDLSNYYTKSETSGATELANAFANIPAGDAEVNNYVQTNSGTIDETVLTYQTNSGSYLTAHQPISANEWNSVYETVSSNSGTWSGGTVESYDLSAGNNIQITKDDVNSAIGIAVTGLNQTNWDNSYTALTSNSANWNNTRTVVYNNSANWDNTRSTVQTNSASWAQGTTYTEGDGIDITNNVISLDSPIVFSAGSGLSVTMNSNTARIDVTAQGGGSTYTGDAQGALDTVYGSSANWNQSTQVVNTNSSTWNSNVFTGVRTYTPEITGDGKNTELHIVSAQQWSDCYNRVAAASAYWPSQSMSSLFEATYGVTPYYEITAAIADKKVVYCRISPTGASRMAFLAYIGSTNVEFQYYRSVNSHSDAQQGDQVFVYTVDNTNAWTTTVRNAFTKVIAGTGLSSTYSNGASGKLTMSIDGSFIGNYATTGDLNYVSGVVGDVESLLAQL